MVPESYPGRPQGWPAVLFSANQPWHGNSKGLSSKSVVLASEACSANNPTCMHRRAFAGTKAESFHDMLVSLLSSLTKGRPNLTSVDSSWFSQIEHEWAQLRQGDPSLDVERFFRHVVSANKVGFLSLESIAAIANGLLTSRCPARLTSAGGYLSGLALTGTHPSGSRLRCLLSRRQVGLRIMRAATSFWATC